MNFNANGYLDPGIHDVDLSAIEEHLVRGFPTSTTRPRIIDGYKRHRSELETLSIELEQLLDGSCQWRRQIVPNGGEKMYQSG